MADTGRLPSAHTDNWEWQLLGSCRSYDSAVFFHPEAERGRARARREAAAKAICRGCPVLAACRNHALTTREPYGVWGGLSEGEREALLRDGQRRAG